MDNRDRKILLAWKTLDNIWQHHLDGSDCYPVPKRFREITGITERYNKLQEHKKWYKNLGYNDVEESMIFDIIFNEVQHILKEALVEEESKKKFDDIGHVFYEELQ